MTTRRRLLTTLTFFALFTLLGWFSFESKFLDDLTRSHQGTLGRRILEESTGVYSFLVLLPFVIWLTRRFPISKRNWFVTIPIALGGAVVTSIAHTTLMAVSRALIAPAVGLGPYDYGIMWYRYPMEFSNDVVSYALIVAAVYGWDRIAAARRAELDAAELRTKLAEAHLENLRLQLNPHFLFNTLNAISAVMYEDVRKADEMLAKLSDFLRTVLASSGVHFVPLEEELAVERTYVDIMTTRLERRLVFNLRVDEAARRAAVPFMILQPLLENSIRHGLTPESGALAITVDVARNGDATVISVADDGAGFAPSLERFGHGLQNVRARLAYTYGSAANFEVGPRPHGGTLATLRFPFQAATS
jgi:two-component sensor histidine kinase